MVLHAIEQGLYEDNAASMAWKLHAIEQTQLRRQHRDDGAGRLKFDFHTGHDSRLEGGDGGLGRPDAQIDLARGRHPVRAARFLSGRRGLPAADLQQREDDVSATGVRARWEAAAQGAVFSLALGEEIG